MIRKAAALVFVCAQFFAQQSVACSAFASSTPVFRVMGKSYDFQLSHGEAVINKRNMKKAALVGAHEQGAEWISKYGSLTYTQFGRDFPISGINEKGLAIEILWDFDTDGPNNRGVLPAVNEAQWIQYQLDVSATVAEAVANSRLVRMKKIYAPVHYLVCDVQGSCAVFEYDGEQVTISDATRLPALANSKYPDSLDYLKNYTGFGGVAPVPYGSYVSKDRFVILSTELNNLNAKATLTDGIAYGFDILKKVRSRGISQWNLIHDLKNGVSYFRRMFEERVTRVTDLKRFDFSCKSPAKTLDLESEDNGDTSAQFADYDAALNRETVEISGRALGMDKALIDSVANYPDTTTCTE